MQNSSPDSKMMTSTLLLLGFVLSLASGESVTSSAPLTSVPEIIDMANISEVTVPMGESEAPIGLSGETSEALPSGDPIGKDPIPEEISEGVSSSAGVKDVPEGDFSASRAADVTFGDGRKSRAEDIYSGNSQRPWPYPGVLVKAVGGRVDPNILSERFGRYEYAGNGLFRVAVGSDSNIGGTLDQTRTLGSSVDVRSAGSTDGSEDNESKFTEDAEDSGTRAGSSGSSIVVENGPESEPLEETSPGSQDPDSGSINEGVPIDNSTLSS